MTTNPANFHGPGYSCGSEALFQNEVPSRSYCTRFVQFIADQCTYFWEGLIDLIDRIQSCFCRSVPAEQPLPDSLASSEAEVGDLEPDVPNGILPSSTTQSQESSSSSAELSSNSSGILSSQSQESSSSSAELPPAPLEKVELPLASSIKPLSTILDSMPSSSTMSQSVEFVSILVKESQGLSAGDKIITRFFKILKERFAEDILSFKNEDERRNEIAAIFLHINGTMPEKEIIDLIINNKHKDFLFKFRSTIQRVGRGIFSCLSAKEQIDIFKKLADIGLIITFRMFFIFTSDVIQNTVKFAINQQNEKTLNQLISSGCSQIKIDEKRASITRELQNYFENEDTPYAQEWNVILQKTLLGSEMQAIVAKQTSVSERAFFAQRVLLSEHESVNPYLHSEEGIEAFNRFSVNDRLWIIECLAALVETERGPDMINPASIVLLVNALPIEIKRKIKTNIGPDLFPGQDYNLASTITALDIKERIFPLISNSVRGLDSTRYIF